MKRQTKVIFGIVLAIAGTLLVWRYLDSRASPTATALGGSADIAGRGAGASVAGKPRPDPSTLARGSIAGTVTDEGKLPIPNAQVCAEGYARDLSPELLREPTCTTTDASGGYTLENLLPARYSVSASARTYRPALHHPRGDRRETELPLAAAERKVGIDIALRPGGVEISGVVADLTGGPIARARVSTRASWFRARDGGASAETDDQGRFSIWVKPGETWVSAAADGYADNSASVHAPGKLEILLTPESSLSGTVTDAVTGQPVEGARVTVATASEWGWDDSDNVVFSDADGTFRATRLTPGRYVAIAKTERGYGRTDGSTLVGLGQSVDGVVVKLWKAYRIEGKVVVSTTEAPCEHPRLSLRDPAKDRDVEAYKLDGGIVVAEGVLPGTYSVSVGCRGYQSRDKYEQITVSDQDLSALVWEVDAGATIRGKVLARSGAPIEDARVWASTVGGAARERQNWSSDTSGRDGSFELLGLKPASYKLETSSDHGVAPQDGLRVDVAAGATIERDLVLDDGGTLKGTVVDPAGRPVSGVSVRARATAAMTSSFGSGDHKSDDSGAFQLDSLRPGEYRVTAQRNWTPLRKPGSTDDAKQGEKAIVRANQTAVVKLVVESQNGTIRGTVVDAEGKPVSDAFVSAARESDAAGAQRTSVQATRWSWDDKPVLTTVDGTFTLDGLSPATYTVRAYRKGGGEAVAERVAIGSTAKLQIKATGTIEGVARRPGGAPAELTLKVSDAATGFSRTEKFYKTDGRFVVRDLPEGNFKLTVSAEGAQKQIELALAEGELKSGVVVELDALVTLTGRVVELGTQTPVPAMRMMASLASGGTTFSFSMNDDELENVTDEAGRFTIKNAPRGKLSIRGFPKNFRDDAYGFVSAVRDVDGTGTVDIGDIGVVKNRVKKGDPVGELGVNFAQQPPQTPPDKRELQVSWIDPAGPAAKTELVVGDVVTTIDGIDVTGGGSSNASTLLRAPPGTKLVLVLARKVTVELTLAPP
jgi:protocatechuate 3,4-dioxygenase beta subunit